MVSVSKATASNVPTSHLINELFQLRHIRLGGHVRSHSGQARNIGLRRQVRSQGGTDSASIQALSLQCGPGAADDLTSDHCRNYLRIPDLFRLNAEQIAVDDHQVGELAGGQRALA
jgi:hypothetical protein